MNSNLLVRSGLTLLCAVLPGFALAQDLADNYLRAWQLLGHGRYTVVTDAEGVVTLQRDLQPLDEDRVERDARALRVLDEDGRALFEIELTADGRVIMPKNATLNLPPAERKRAVIGVNLAPVSEALAAQLEVDPEKTVLISEVTDGQPAARAGLKRFDVVTAIDGEGPAGSEGVKKQLAKKKAGETLTLTVRRGGATLDVPIEVEEVAVPEADADLWVVGSLAGDTSSLATVKYVSPGVWGLDLDSSGKFHVSAVEAMKQKKDGAAVDAEQDDLAELNERLRRVEELLEKLVADEK